MCFMQISSFMWGRATALHATTSNQCTAWRHIMAHVSNWYKTEVKIFNNNGSLSPTLTHFRFTNKEVKVMTEII